MAGAGPPAGGGLVEMSAHERCHPMLIPAFPCQSTGKLTFNPPRALLCRGKHRALKILLRAKKELKSVGKCRHRCLGFGAAEAAPGGRSGRGRRGRGGRRSLLLPTAPGRCLSPPRHPHGWNPAHIPCLAAGFVPVIAMVLFWILPGRGRGGGEGKRGGGGG